MDEILKKLGIYDLVAVLLTGICINILTCLMIKYLFSDMASNWIVTNNLIVFWVSSYLLGIIFQEIGSFVNGQTFNKDNKLLEMIFGEKKENNKEEGNKEKYSLTKEERKEVKKIVKKELGLEEDPNEEICYNYCRYYLMKHGSIARADKDQSIAGMSRGLAIYFFLEGIILLCYADKIEEISCRIKILIISLSYVFSVLLYCRNIRFLKMRYLNIIRGAYYNYKINKNEENWIDSRNGDLTN